jgi:myo-inositol 2-dehydrogenase / D-chiro-inositol 1-dehydrogenase
MDKINVGVIGAGRIGQIHARNIKFRIPGAKLHAVADVNVEVARRVATELEVPVVTGDHRQLMEDPSIGAIVICSSTDTHAGMMIEAALAGKHLFCEKPIALDMDRIDQALAAVAKSGVKLQVGFNRRFDPSFRKVRELIAAGRIGVPQLLRISSRDPQPPPLDYVKCSGGLFLDMMIHDFDMARFLVGEEVTELMATGNCQVDPEIGKCGDVDTAVVLLKFKSGALGTIDNSRRAVYGYDQRVEVFGSEGCAAAGNKIPTEVTLHNADSTTSDKPLYFFLERYEEAYLAEMKEFINCIQENRVPAVGGFDGRVSVAMGYAALESLKSGNFVQVKS